MIKALIVAPDAKPVNETRAATSEDATIVAEDGKQYSIRSMRHDIADGRMFEDLKTYVGYSNKNINKLKQDLTALTNYMAQYADILDMNETYNQDNPKQKRGNENGKKNGCRGIRFPFHFYAHQCAFFRIMKKMQKRSAKLQAEKPVIPTVSRNSCNKCSNFGILLQNLYSVVCIYCHFLPNFIKKAALTAFIPAKPCAARLQLLQFPDRNYRQVHFSFGSGQRRGSGFQIFCFPQKLFGRKPDSLRTKKGL